jgi:TonB-linked SusC/RagA family outer membrane protein
MGFWDFLNKQKKIMKRVLLLACVYCITLLIGAAWAQQRTVTGRVISEENREPLPGVNVVLRGTTVGTVTDLDGLYSIDVPTEGGTLVFSFIGLETREVAIGNQTTINLTMRSDVRQLGEIVVTALGIEQERRALSYATERVERRAITQASQPNLGNALQGKVAGLEIRQSSGMPGASSLITLRGARFLSGNNQPLIVVDGMPIESGPVFVEAVTESRVSGTDASSRLLDINPEDIESIDVLKGPAAAALYGLRAGNGVIIITTSRGRGVGERARINFTTSYTADVVSKTPSLQSTYAQGSGGAFNPATSLSWGPTIESLGEYTNNVGEQVTGQVYDNVSPFFQTGGTFTADLGVSGSTDRANYNVSFGSTSQEGFIPTTGMNRYTGRISGEFRAADNLRVGGSMMYTHLNIDKIASGSNLSNPLFTTYFAPRSYDLWGTPYHVEGDPFTQIHYRAAMDNPRWSLANNRFDEENDRFLGNINFDYHPLDWLQVRYQLGMDQFTNNQKEVYEMGSGETGGRSNPPGGKITDFAYNQRQYNSNFNIGINTSLLDLLSLNFVVGNELYDIRSREINNVGQGFSIGGFHNMANTQSQIIHEDIQRRRVVGFYGSLTVGLGDLVFFSATGRNDYISNLARGNRSFFYPSVGASFVFSELFDVQGISSGKFRASYAEIGQSYDGNYPTQNIFIAGTSSVGGFLTDGIQFPFAGRNAFTQSNILRSPDLMPQNTRTVELGLEMGFVNDRVFFDYTYFLSRVVDQIFEVPIAPSTGFESELRNAGRLESRGHEISLTLTPVATSNVRWDFTTNFTRYKNRVLELAPGVTNIYLGGFVTPSIRALEGQTFPSIFGVGYLRDDQGRIVMLDQPGSARHGMPMADEVAKKIGDVQPDFMMGFNNTFTFGGFTLAALFDWRSGGDMYSGNNRLGRLYGILSITEDRNTPLVLEGVKGYISEEEGLVITGENDIAIVRGQTYWSDVVGNIDEAHVHKTSYVRFRELSLGFTLPPTILRNTFMQSASLSVVGRNLALWSAYPNFDPETSTTGAVNGQGLEYVAHPQIASFGARLNVVF